MTTEISLKEPLIQACSELLPKFGLKYSFVEEISEKTLNSAESINLLVGLNHGIQGNIILGLTSQAALRIVAGIIGEDEVFTLDNQGRNALSDFMTMIARKAVSKLEISTAVDISPPTLITGDTVFSMISKIPSQKLSFNLENTTFSISYCIE
ncbi:MAG TPA: chemotaxis protein CheX [Candidatus Gastranaerophilales bacterium]|nr:chemotaxis protein CheX [Candidatus Gastranaerophilales bacterium]